MNNGPQVEPPILFAAISIAAGADGYVSLVSDSTGLPSSSTSSLRNCLPALPLG